MKLGHPADCNSKKETVQAKIGITKSKKEVSQTLNKNKEGLPIQNKLSTSEPLLEHQSKDSSKV